MKIFLTALQDLLTENETDINLKEMIFNDRMKAIEDDVVPFGFHDDGSDWIDEKERQEQPWYVQYDFDRDEF